MKTYILEFETIINIKVINYLLFIYKTISNCMLQNKYFEVINDIKTHNKQIIKAINDNSLILLNFDYQTHLESLVNYIEAITNYSVSGWSENDSNIFILSVEKAFDRYWSKLIIK